ncbi:MAG: hypothetical protein EBU90_01715 [Proteobacteria bacterium]|nr:hypothetical protein [Pseudomonadota bacterium]
MAKSKKDKVKEPKILGLKQVGKILIVSIGTEESSYTKNKTISEKEKRDEFKLSLKTAIENPEDLELHKRLISEIESESSVEEKVVETVDQVVGTVKNTEEFQNAEFAIKYMVDNQNVSKSYLEENKKLKEFVYSDFGKHAFDVFSVPETKDELAFIIKNTNLAVPKDVLIKMSNSESRVGLIEFFKKVSLNPDPIAAKGILKYIKEETHFRILDNGFVIGYKKVQRKSKPTKEDELIEKLSKDGADLEKLKFDYKGGEVSVVDAKVNEFTILKKIIKSKNSTTDKSVYTDSRSESMNISLFSPVVISREKCDTNPRNACSYGLHVGTYNYASSFSGNVLLMVAFSPEDAVAVPQDGGKIRVCRYYPVKVLKDVTHFSELPEIERLNILAALNTLEIEYAKEQITKDSEQELFKLSYSELVSKLSQLQKEGDQEIIKRVERVLFSLYTTEGVHPSIISLDEELEKQKEEITKSATSKKGKISSLKKNEVPVQTVAEEVKSESAAPKKKGKVNKVETSEVKEKSKEELFLETLKITKEEKEKIEQKLNSVTKMRHKPSSYLVYRKSELDSEKQKVTSIVFAKATAPLSDYYLESLGNLADFKEEFDKYVAE